MTAPYPLIFEPILMAKVWGGDRLARFGKKVNAGETIGESWEIADLESTAAGGAGGGAQRSIITNGALKGKTLGEALRLDPVAMLGAGSRKGTGFPLLVKFLDARENLSVQVHPSPAYAAANVGASLKTESWFILDAAPGSVIYKGLKAGVTRESLARHIADGTVLDDLVSVQAIPGECHTLPSGTCHALGAGVLVAEIQTPSDTTFRVYDWGRTGRALHIDQSLECIHYGPAPGPRAMRSPTGGLGPVEKTEFYAIAHLTLSNEGERPVATSPACVIVMVLAGVGSLYSENGACAPIDLRAGMTVLIPAVIAADVTVRAPDAGRIECLLATLPSV